MKKIAYFLLAIVTLLYSFNSIYASSDIENQIDQKNEEIESLTKEIEKLDEEISKYDSEISELEKEIADIEDSSKEYEKDIAELNKSIGENEDLVELSLVSLQKTYNSNTVVNYMFDSGDDAMDNVGTITKTIYGSMDIVSKYIYDKEVIAYNYEQIDKNISEKEEKISEIEAKRSEIDKEVSKYQSDIDEINSSLSSLHEELIAESIGINSSGGKIAEADRESVMSAAGISPSDYEYVDMIITRESGWNYMATNSSSGAYGLCQSLPGSKMASAGSDWKTNPVTQMKWCNGYAVQRYGSWEGAYNFWNSNHWW